MANAFNVPHKFDKSNLRKVILEAPKQFEEGFRLGSNIELTGRFLRAVFYGEGGSAFPVSLVDTLVKDAAYKVGKQAPGIYQVSWDGKNERGQTVSTGVYFYLLEAGEHKEAKKMLLLK